jgi:anhydro-N-acetylmuramic acid kinase
MLVLGFMTGTSLDAVDMAVLETDGGAIDRFGPAGERKLSEAVRNVVLEATKQALAWRRGEPEPPIFAHAAEMVAEEHYIAAEAFLAANGLSWPDIDLIGMHGQTVLHERPKDGVPGRTVQLGDGAMLARLTGRRVVFDFRSADVAAGGEGAPLAAVYHLARARKSGLAAPLAVLNVGGVANVTLWRGGAWKYGWASRPRTTVSSGRRPPGGFAAAGAPPAPRGATPKGVKTNTRPR